MLQVTSKDRFNQNGNNKSIKGDQVTRILCYRIKEQDKNLCIGFWTEKPQKNEGVSIGPPPSEYATADLWLIERDLSL